MTLPRVIGLGSHHGDDQAGWLMVDFLRDLGYPSTLLRKAAHPVELLDDVTSTPHLLVCDACEDLDDVGAIHQWQWPADALKGLRSRGTHDMPLAQVLELAVQFTEHQFRVEVWGVTGSHWAPVAPACPAVQAASRAAAARIWSRHRA